MTQHLQKLNKKLFNEAAVRRTLHSWGSMRDPFFRIAIFDWYELIAAFVTGKYRVPTVCYRASTQRRGIHDQSSRGVQAGPRSTSDSSIASSRATTAAKKGTRRKRQFEKRSKLGLLGWFFSQALVTDHEPRLHCSRCGLVVLLRRHHILARYLHVIHGRDGKRKHRQAPSRRTHRANC